MAQLNSKFSEQVPFPKGLMIWNYFDHEHVVGTHFQHYRHVRILAEADNWCFSQRSATLPFIPVKMWATQFGYLKSENWMRCLHFGPFGLLLEQDFHFEDVAPAWLPCDCGEPGNGAVDLRLAAAVLSPPYAPVVLLGLGGGYGDARTAAEGVSARIPRFRRVGLRQPQDCRPGAAGYRKTLSDTIACSENYRHHPRRHLTAIRDRQAVRLWPVRVGRLARATVAVGSVAP